MIFEKKKNKKEMDDAYVTGHGGDPLGQRETWLIGRNRPCDIVYADSSVSRKHAQIVETADGFYLSDLHSANGTFVNGYRLTGETRIYEEDELQFGTVKIRFTADMLD